MRQGYASTTAWRVAALRAQHQVQDAPQIFTDPLAARLVAAGTASGAAVPIETSRLRATLAARAAVAEAAIGAAAGRGVTQCVLLGAGFETFAYRQSHDRLLVFEIDHPATQAAKRDLLRRATIAIPASVRYVAIDFVDGDLAEALRGGGFDGGQAAVFTLMGVVPYLPSDILMRLVAAVAACAPGSELVLDYTEPFDQAPSHVRVPYEAAAARVAAEGEPWVAFYRPAALHAGLVARGFVIEEDLDAAALDARFCAGRTDGLRVAPLVHVLRARLGSNLQDGDASRHHSA